MLQLVEDQWNALAVLSKHIGAKRIDILTGFIGKGAAQALSQLGLRARIVIGLPGGHAGLSKAQIDEIAMLQRDHEVRWLSGLHAKLYLLDERAVIIGSANFTRSGFEHLDEIGVASDDPALVIEAVSAFNKRFNEAKLVDVAQLQIVTSSESDDDGDAIETGLGVAWNDRISGFTKPRNPDGADDDTDALFVNVGEGEHRCWEDCRRYGFISAGQAPRFSRQLSRLEEGANIYAYLVGHGYVGRGTVVGSPRMARDHVVEGTPLFALDLEQPGIKTNADDPDNAEWVVPIRWHKTVDRFDATLSHLFRRRHVVCRLLDEATRKQLAAAFAD